MKENRGLKRMTDGPYNAIPSELLRHGKSGGLRLGGDGVSLTGTAAHYRVAARSATLEPGLEGVKKTRNDRGLCLMPSGVNGRTSSFKIPWRLRG